MNARGRERGNEIVVRDLITKCYVAVEMIETGQGYVEGSRAASREAQITRVDDQRKPGNR